MPANFEGCKQCCLSVSVNRNVVKNIFYQETENIRLSTMNSSGKGRAAQMHVFVVQLTGVKLA